MTTQVAFHVNVPDPLGYACRLVRKGYLRGVSMLVLCAPQQLRVLDAQLWGLRPAEFVPHCFSGDTGAVAERSQVVLTGDLGSGLGRSFDVLVNLTHDIPLGFEAFDKVFEVVSLDERDLQSARARWRAYQQAGAEPTRHASTAS